MEQSLQPPSQTPQAQLTATMTNLSNFQGQFNMDKSGYNPNMPGHATDHSLITRQQPRTVKQVGAGIGLPFEVRHEMALQLDDHQCALNVAVHQYRKHHWMSEGAESFLSLHELLNEHIEKTNDHIDEIWRIFWSSVRTWATTCTACWRTTRWCGA